MKLEMRTVQKIAAAAMTLAVMFGCASPLKPLAASAAQNPVSVSAEMDEENSCVSAQDQMYQKDFLNLINKARAKAGLNSVQLGDATHNTAAAERAEELATTYSYVRPNGQRDFTVFCRERHRRCVRWRELSGRRVYSGLRHGPVDEPRFRP